MNPARFVTVLLVLIAALLLSAGLVNVLVDPYDIFGMPRIKGFNAKKPAADTHTPMVKAFQMERAAPRTVLFGTSRVDIGLDPDHPAWPQTAKPVYNYGYPGVSLEVILQQLPHAARAGPLRLAVVALEFHDFLSPQLSQANEPNEIERRLKFLSGTESDAARNMQRLSDATSATLTLRAVIDSLDTVLRQRGTSGGDVNEQGLTSEASFTRFARTDGYNDLFTQTDLSIAKARDYAAHRLSGTSPTEFAELVYVRSIVEFCRDRNIEVYLFIPPYHADYLEIAGAVGLWDRFEGFKIALVNLVEEYQGKKNSVPIALWDFASYDGYTTEVVPAKGDLQTPLKWFWEPAHFKKALGDIMLSRMQGSDEYEFGVRLSSTSISARLADGRARRAAYRAANPGEVQRVAALIQSARQARDRSLAKSAVAAR